MFIRDSPSILLEILITLNLYITLVLLTEQLFDYNKGCIIVHVIIQNVSIVIILFVIL